MSYENPLSGGKIQSVLFPTIDGYGLAPVFVLRQPFSAAGGGSPDDVIIYNSTAPFGFRILDSFVYISTTVVASTVTLRNATGGGGSAVSDTFLSSAAGQVRLSTLTSTSTISIGGTLVLRLSDNGVAGEVIVLIAKT